MGGLGPLAQKGLDLWAQQWARVMEDAKPEGLGIPCANRGHGRNKEDPQDPPHYLILNGGQQTCQLAELGHHVGQIGFTWYLGGKDKNKQGMPW